MDTGSKSDLKETMPYAGCSFCHHQENTLYAKDHKMRSGTYKDIYQCSECKCLYHRERKVLSKIPEFLSTQLTNIKDYNSADMQEQINKDNYVIKMLKKLIAPQGTALDIGAYIGGFVYNLNTLGFNAFGIEPQVNATKFARENSLNIFTGMFPDNIPDEIPQSGYSLASFMESICYSTNLKNTFNRVHKILLPNGYLLIQNICGSSYMYKKNNDSFFKRFNDYVQVIPTFDAIQYWLTHSGFEIMHMVELPAFNINKFYKHEGQHLNGLYTNIGTILNAFHQSLFRNIETADKLIVLARKTNT